MAAKNIKIVSPFPHCHCFHPQDEHTIAVSYSKLTMPKKTKQTKSKPLWEENPARFMEHFVAATMEGGSVDPDFVALPFAEQIKIALLDVPGAVYASQEEEKGKGKASNNPPAILMMPGVTNPSLFFESLIKAVEGSSQLDPDFAALPIEEQMKAAMDFCLPASTFANMGAPHPKKDGHDETPVPTDPSSKRSTTPKATTSKKERDAAFLSMFGDIGALLGDLETSQDPNKVIGDWCIARGVMEVPLELPKNGNVSTKNQKNKVKEKASSKIQSGSISVTTRNTPMAADAITVEFDIVDPSPFHPATPSSLAAMAALSTRTASQGPATKCTSPFCLCGHRASH